MKRLLLFVAICSFWSGFSQAIDVSTNAYTVPQLIEEVLFGTGSNGGGGACAGSISNISWSTGTNFGSDNGIGYFTNFNPSFPLSSGVILSTGNANNAEGPNNTVLGDGAVSWPGDSDLFNYIQGLGIDPGLEDYNNATVLEFDFTPLTDWMSFDFLFASEEYGDWQCLYSDAFAFFLTDVTAGTPPVNLAVIPNTTTPISVVTIRDMQHNTGCSSQNPFYFANFNGDGNAGNSATNFNGETILMTAGATVVPNHVYHIKLVIADRNDQNFDSAVFLGGGSFNIGQANILAGGEYEGVEDFTIGTGTPICGGSELILNAGSSPISGANYSWAHDGVTIPNSNSFSHVVTEPGIYTVTVEFASGCEQSDSIQVDFSEEANLGDPIDVCPIDGTTFNLTLNTPIILNGNGGDITYHQSAEDAAFGIPITNPQAYQGELGQTIYATYPDFNTGCTSVRSFQLKICDATAQTPPDMILCEDSVVDGSVEFDLTEQIPDILGDADSADFTITFHTTLAAAQADSGAIGNSADFANSSNPQTIYVRFENNVDPTIYSTVSFQLIVLPPPTTPTPSNVVECDSYTLPGLPAGSTYHSESGGSPTTQIAAGTAITESQTIYIYAQSGTEPNCTAEGSFTVTISDTPIAPSPADVARCGEYLLPDLPAGSVYHSGSITGPVVNPGTLITSTETFFVVATSPDNADCSSSGSFTVTITDIPTTPTPANVTRCQGYVLPDLPAGSTYHQGTATGPVINAGVTITETQTIVIVAQNGDCSAEGSFEVEIIPTPQVDVIQPVVACDDFTLPNLNVGNYFTGPNGTGTPYFAGDIIDSDIQLYIYAASGACTSESSFTISLFSSPTIFTPTRLEVCDDNNDGFSCGFILSQKVNEITGGASGLEVTFHETQTDAQNGVNAITAASYCNIVTGIQVLHVRVFNPSAPLCASLTTLELRVNPVPVANLNTPDYALCDTTGAVGVESFDLPSWNAQVLNGQTGIEVTHYTSLADAQAGTNAIDTTTGFENTSSPQQIFVRLENPTTGCFSVGSFNIVVNALPTVVAPAPMNACSNGDTGTAEFNLSLNDPIISGGVPGVSVSYYLTLADAQNEQNPIGPLYTNQTPFSQTVFVRVENQTTGCFDTTSLVLNVTQGPLAVTPMAISVCDPNSNGFTTFDIDSASLEISGGAIPAGVQITYHETQTDALNGVNAVSSPYDNIVAYNQTLYVRVAYDLTGCANYVELQLIVNDTPQGTEIDPLEVCDNDSDGIGAFNLTSAVAGILGDLDPATHDVTFYVSQANAQSGINPITNVLAFTNNTPNQQTIWVRVENNETTCFDVLELGLIVNPLPIAPVGAAQPYSLCDVTNSGDEKEVFDLESQIPGILNGQSGMIVTFHFSLADAQSGENDLPLEYTNVVNAQTIHVRIENENTGCFVTTTLDLRVEPLPILILPTNPVTVCDADADGFAEFDLDALVSNLLQGAPDTNVTFHETLTDAQNGVNAFVSPYQNIVPQTQMIYVRAENTLTGCSSVNMIELVASPAPSVPALEDQLACDEYGNTQDGFTRFNLTTQETAILNAQSGPPAGYSIRYFLSEADALAGTSPIIGTTNFINTQNPQMIWVRVSDVSNTCFNIGSFELQVNVPLALTTPTQLSICDDGQTTAVPTAEFDLTQKDNEITGGAAGYTVAYYLTQADAQAGTNAIENPTQFTNTANAQTLFVAVTGPAPESCRSFTTLTIRVLPLPAPELDPEQIQACETAVGSGEGVVDLTQNEDYLADNDPDLAFEYYTTQANAETGTNMIADPENHTMATGSVWIRVMRDTQPNSQGDFCAVIVEQAVVINPLPVVATTPVVYQMCDPDPTVAGAPPFVLNTMNAAVINEDPTQVTSDFTFTYHLTAADAQSGSNPLANTYTSVSNPQDIYVRVVNTATGCVNATGVVTLTIEAGASATITNVGPLEHCDDDGVNDGQYAFDLTLLSADIVGPDQDVNVFTVAYFPTEGDALLNENEIATPQSYLTGEDVWAVVTNTATGCRSEAVRIVVNVEQLAEPVISSVEGGNTICVDFTTGELLSGLTLTSNIDNSENLYTFAWYKGLDLVGTGETLSITDPVNGQGAYTLQVTSTSDLACGSVISEAFTVERSSPAVVLGEGYSVTGAFADNQTITVLVEGYGDYVYSLDGGPFVANGGVFTGVGSGLNGDGEHTIIVRDANGCGPDQPIGVINTIDYPPYFTPNGDGIHDTWNIIGLGASQPSAKIYIFDRYGKLIKQISPVGEGWDGTYNGQPMPSTDYWFRVEYAEGTKNKEFRAHFSLKR